jgi:hypothetical protein
MKKIASICVLTLILVLNGCSKYDDGPSFSLRTKKARLINKWKIEKLLIDGIESGIQGIHPPNLDVWVEFKKDDTFENFWGNNGYWEFSDSKEKINLFSENSLLLFELSILKLTNNELWFEYEAGNQHHEEHYKTY